MRKLILNSIFGILTALACTSYALAALPPPVCQNFTGKLVLTPDLDANFQPACQLLERSDTRWYFTDLLSPSSPSQFLANLQVPPPFGSWCFTGAIQGMLDNQPVTGVTYSGQTTNNFPIPSPGTFPVPNSAATTLILNNRAGLPLGNIYFRDTFFITDSSGSAKEQLVVIAGSGLFWGIKGTMQIAGYEFAPPGADITGQLCR